MSIQVCDLCFSYGDRPVLRSIGFQAEPGQLISLLGPNGAGKSTLLRCILGLLRPSSGRVLVDGRDARTMDARELARHIAYIPQTHHPVYPFQVLDMVLMGATAHMSLFSVPGPAQHRRAMEALERLDIAHLAHRSCAAVSGGEQQLVLIARALAQQAGCLILDEPTASLDLGNRIAVMQTLQRLAREGCCVIQTTHDPDQAYLYSHRLLALKDGQLLAQGAPREILDGELMSRLYGTELAVCSLQGDALRVCVPKTDLIKEESL